MISGPGTDGFALNILLDSGRILVRLLFVALLIISLVSVATRARAELPCESRVMPESSSSSVDIVISDAQGS